MNDLIWFSYSNIVLPMKKSDLPWGSNPVVGNPEFKTTSLGP